MNWRAMFSPVRAAVALLGLHWLMQGLGVYELMFDETQYWMWGKFPAWGYYSKPPMIGWLMGLSTTLFGDGIFGVKMLAPVLHIATASLLMLTARRFGEDVRTSHWVFITYLTLPLVIGGSAFFSADTPLLFFWSGALYGVIRALQGKSGAGWLLAGGCLGLGLLSKYTMGAFALSTGLALLTHPQRRAQLRTIWPWLGGILAALIFAPNLVWNAQHHFVTVAHTETNLFSKQIEFYPFDMLAFFGAQFLVFGPILMAVLLLIFSRGTVKASAMARLMFWYVWPLLAIGLAVSLVAGAQAHWVAPAYLGGLLIVVPWLRRNAPRLLKRSLILHLCVLAIFYVTPLALPHVTQGKTPLTRLFVWNRLATPLRTLLETYPKALLLSDERKIAAALTYQLRAEDGTPARVLKWNPSGVVQDHYDILSQGEELKGRSVLLISRSPQPPGLSVATADAHCISRYQREGMVFYIFYLPDFAGYE